MYEPLTTAHIFTFPCVKFTGHNSERNHSGAAAQAPWQWLEPSLAHQPRPRLSALSFPARKPWVCCSRKGQFNITEDL